MTEIQTAEPVRGCDGCTFCCKIMGVKELDKPVNKWCPECTIGKGCNIYNDRPRECQEFICAWLTRADIPLELRPDKCHVMFTGRQGDGTVHVHVDPARPFAHRSELVDPLIRQMLAHQLDITIIIGKERTLLRNPKKEGSVDDVLKKLREGN